MIYNIFPFSTTKAIGEAYNGHCELVPNETDWILITDYDVLILDPRAFTLMEKATVAHHDTEIFVCYTNRIGYENQRLNGKVEDNDSILHHLQMARQQADKYPNGESIKTQTAAGFFMLFQKRYWLANKFQDGMFKNERLFDWNFQLSAMRKGSIKLIQGIYVWHTWRLGNPQPRDISHLR